MTRKTMPPAEVGNALMTIREVAALDRCSEKTVRRAIAAGLLEVVRIGPRGHLVRIAPEAHEAYRRGRHARPVETAHVHAKQ